MTIEYIGDGNYQGILRRHNGASILHGKNRMDILRTLIVVAFGKEKQPVYRYEEEAWTDDDWERDFRRDEIIGQHKDDDKI